MEFIMFRPLKHFVAEVILLSCVPDVCMTLAGAGRRLQTCGGLAAQLFDSTLRTLYDWISGMVSASRGGLRHDLGIETSGFTKGFG